MDFGLSPNLILKSSVLEAAAARRVNPPITYFGQILAPTGQGQGGIEVAIVVTATGQIVTNVVTDPSGAWVLSVPFERRPTPAALRVNGLADAIPLETLAGTPTPAAGSIIGPVFLQLPAVPADLAATGPASALLTALPDAVHELLRRAPQLWARGISTSVGTPCSPFTPRDGAAEVHRFAHIVMLQPTDPRSGGGDQTPALPLPVGADPGPGPGGLRYAMLLELEQTWQNVGLALGDLLYSLPLAPAEAVNLAVVDWQRTQSGTRSSSDEEFAAEDQSLSRNRTVQDVLQSHANRRTDAFQINGSVTGTMGAVTATVSGGYSNTNTTTDIAQTATQNLSDSVRSAASATRSARSVTIVQTTEAESSSTTTRTVRNHNHAHTLTFQYFEVVQRYLVSTRVKGVAPLVLVPFAPIDFSDADVIDRYGDILVRHLPDPSLVDDLRRWLDRERPPSDDHAASPAPPEPPPDDPTVMALEIDVDTTGDADFPRDAGEMSNYVVLSIGDGQMHRVQWREMGDRKRVADVHLWPGTPRSRLTRLGIANVHSDRNPEDNHGNLQFASIEVEVRYRDGRTEVATHDTNVALPMLTTYSLTWQLPVPAPPVAHPVPAPGARLASHLQANRLAYTATVLTEGDGLARWALLSRVADADGNAITDIANGEPVGVVGPYLALELVSTEFVPAAAVPAGDVGGADPWAPDAYAEVGADEVIVLPTGGVFAESQLGSCPAAETIDNSVYWQWTDDSSAPAITDEMVKSRMGELKELLAFVNPSLTADTITPPDEPAPHAPPDPSLGETPTVGQPPGDPAHHDAPHHDESHHDEPEHFAGSGPDNRLTLTFAPGQADFTTVRRGDAGRDDTRHNADNLAALQVFVDNAQRVRATAVRIVGYASHSGRAAANQQLARRRADATAAEIRRLWTNHNHNPNPDDNPPTFDESGQVADSGTVDSEWQKAEVWITASRGAAAGAGAADAGDSGGSSSSSESPH